MKTKWQDFTLIPHPYVVQLVVNEKEFLEASKSVGVPIAGTPQWIDDRAIAQLHEIEGFDGLLYFLISLNERANMPPENVAALLCHEAVHCFQRVCLWMGEHEPSKEFEAYSIQMIALTLMQQYKKKLFQRRYVKV